MPHLILLQSISSQHSSISWASRLRNGQRCKSKIAEEYLDTYRGTCEYFYLTAKRFSKSTLELEDIGLLDLTRMKVIKSSDYLYPDMDFRANLMKGIKNNFKVLTNAVDDDWEFRI
jgi:hypothetical protein